MFPFKFGLLTDIWLYIVCNLAGSGHAQSTIVHSDNASSRESENSAQYPLAYPRGHQG